MLVGHVKLSWKNAFNRIYPFPTSAYEVALANALSSVFVFLHILSMR